MTKPGKIIIISGPSGVGKDTIIRGILKKFPSLVMVKSYTTRPKRKSDEVGNRHFVSHEEFLKMIKDGKMIEYKEYCGNLYGRVRANIDKPLSDGRNIIMEVEVKGTLDYQKIFGSRVVAIFIKYENPSQFISRIKKNRPETSRKVLQDRKNSIRQEMKYEKYYNYSIINPEGQAKKAIVLVANILRNVLK